MKEITERLIEIAVDSILGDSKSHCEGCVDIYLQCQDFQREAERIENNDSKYRYS